MPAAARTRPAWRTRLAALGLSTLVTLLVAEGAFRLRAHLRNAPWALDDDLGTWHGEPQGLGRMRDLQRALDPDGRFARGRLAGGL